MAELPDADQGGADSALGSLDAELVRTDSPPRWLRGPVVRGGSLRVGVLTGFVASFIPTALLFNGGGMPRTAILVGILLLLIAGMAAISQSRRRTGIGAIAGLLVGAGLAGIVAFVTSLFDALARAPF